MTTRQYLAVGVGLAGLVLLGVALSYLPVSPRMVAFLVLLLSTVKAILVAFYYMHLKLDAKFLTWVALAPIPFGIVLVTVLLLDAPTSR